MSKKLSFNGGEFTVLSKESSKNEPLRNIKEVQSILGYTSHKLFIDDLSNGKIPPADITIVNNYNVKKKYWKLSTLINFLKGRVN
jgi:hypothetical protein